MHYNNLGIYLYYIRSGSCEVKYFPTSKLQSIHPCQYVDLGTYFVGGRGHEFDKESRVKKIKFHSYYC